MKILIIGHARHGKDTLASIINDIFGLKFTSSSQAASDIFIYNNLKDKYDYKSPLECFEDRVNHRKEWHDLICEYNKKDKSRLAKKILESSNIYVGMRSSEELQECLNQKLFDYVIGIFDPNKKLENKDSFNIDMFYYSDFIFSNSGSISNLKDKVRKVMSKLLKYD